MNQLPPHLASLIEAARREHDPAAGDMERVHLAVLEAVAVPPASLPPRAVPPKGLPGAMGKGAGSMALKLLVVGGVLGISAVLLPPAKKAPAPAPISDPTPPQTTLALAGSESVNEHEAVPAIERRVQERLLPERNARATDTPARGHRRQERKRPASERLVRLTPPDASAGARADERVEERPSARRQDAEPGSESLQERGANSVESAGASGSKASVNPAGGDEAQSAGVAPAEPRPGEAAPAAARARAPNQDELALLRDTLVALRDSAPERALALLERHAQSFPSGILTQERRALRVVALCASGRLDAGRSERTAFLQQDPNSPLAVRVRAACATLPTP